MMRSGKVRKAFRVALYGLLVMIVLEIGMILSPVDILVQSQKRAVFADYDILYDVPSEVSWAKAGNKVRWERMCIYWGGTMTNPVPAPIDSRCPLLRRKPDGARVL